MNERNLTTIPSLLSLVMSIDNSGTASSDPAQQTFPDTGVRGSNSMKIFRTAGLSQAHHIFHEDTYLVCLPNDNLWQSYLPENHILPEVKSHLVKIHWLSGEGKWDSIDGEKIDGKQFAVRSEDGNEGKPFMFFSRLFNVVLDFVRQCGCETPIKTMVDTGFIGPGSTKVGTHRPDAFLHMATGVSLVPNKFRWRDLASPFEYKFGDGNAVDVS